MRRPIVLVAAAGSLALAAVPQPPRPRPAPAVEAAETVDTVTAADITEAEMIEMVRQWRAGR